MIQSLFDSEEEKKESEKPENKITEPLKFENPAEYKTAEKAENQQLSGVELNESEPSVNNSEATVEVGKEEVLENPQKMIINSDSESSSDFETQSVVKEIEFGDNFLELEKEVAKIEEEVRLESDEKNEETIKTENLSKIETKSEPEKIEPKPIHQGIFTTAINKSQQKNESVKPLENLLIVPNENQSDSEPLPNETQGFILPNRITPPTENSSENTVNESFQPDYKPESKAAIIRKSGLAWSAGIAFFGSVIFVLILGWFADLLLGTSPWMAVGGVVLGAIIGFIQLFRLTSQILKDND